MEPFEISGAPPGTALRFTPARGRLVMAVTGRNAGGHQGVLLQPAWLRPLAAWFAGDGEPVHLGGDALLPYARRLAVYPDDLALVWSTHTEAWLRCSCPYGGAGVVIGPRGRMATRSLSVRLSPRARLETAERLRHADAESWARPAA